MDIFDTHAHLLDEKFDENREQLIASLPAQGVKLVMETCTDLAYLEKQIRARFGLEGAPLRMFLKARRASRQPVDSHKTSVDIWTRPAPPSCAILVA